ncbi:MAG: hypothetical protein IJN65_03215 [Clostridia bacterium]|nr:hypothetical protein [Clostridia bacterium]
MKKSKFLKLISACICLIFVFCSCANSTHQNEGKPENSGSDTQNTENITLIYSATDSLNPYRAVTEANAQVSLLMFDPLIKIDSDFNPVNILAESINKSEDGSLKIKLKSAAFTDSTPLTSADVVFSYNLAKQSKTKYAYQLESVISCTALGEREVEFKFSKNDPYAVNLLDFPIIKADSDNRTDQDNVALAPIGCGRYLFDRENEQLVANENYHAGDLSVKSIALLNSPDDEAIDHNISVGAVDMYFTDLSKESITRMSGKRTSVNLNNLIYLGANMSEDHILSNVHLRYAVSAAISREQIAKEAYYQNAVSATGIFNPAFEPSSQYQTLQKTADKQIVVVNLSQIGYNTFDSEGYAVNSKGKRLALSILVNEESSYKKLAATLLAKQMCDAGIYTTVTAVPYAEYMARLARGEFSLYIAETIILNNMDITELVCPGGSAAYGVKNPTPPPQQDEQVGTQESVSQEPANQPEAEPTNDINCEQILKSFYSGECEIGSVCTIFESQLPIIPVVYKTGILFYSNDIETTPQATLSDIFFSLENFKINPTK